MPGPRSISAIWAEVTPIRRSFSRAASTVATEEARMRSDPDFAVASAVRSAWISSSSAERRSGLYSSARWSPWRTRMPV